ncbi:MAG: SDR family oxidoreductase [Clostridia bacterium]|nr:SDR family oxidoreductase [Clostridia bacterium]
MSKIVVITGASRGIGKETALHLSSVGYKVIGTYLNSIDSANELVKKGIDMVRCNVSLNTDVTRLFNYVTKKYGEIYAVINNAGVSFKQKFILDVTDKEFDDTVSVNLKGVFNGTKIAVEKMLGYGGKILNVSSVLALSGGSCESVYTATKAGVLAFSRAVSEELNDSKLSVCSLVIGLIDTDMNAHLKSEEKMEFVKNHGLKKVYSAKDVAKRISKILNEKNVNGKIFKIFVGKK